MSKTTASLAAKGLDSTGVTDELAKKYHSKLGSTHMAVIEYQVTARTDGNDGDHSVKLSILTVEPAVTPETAEHLRNLQRALYTNRTPATLDGQSTLADVEPSVDAVIAVGADLAPSDT